MNESMSKKANYLAPFRKELEDKIKSLLSDFEKKHDCKVVIISPPTKKSELIGKPFDIFLVIDSKNLPQCI